MQGIEIATKIDVVRKEEYGYDMKDLGKLLKSEKIQSLKLQAPICVGRTTPLSEVFSQMSQSKSGVAIIIDKGKKVLGIFTERDAVRRVFEQEIDLKTPIEQVMTPDPKSLKKTETIAKAISLMNKGGYRNLLLIDDQGDPSEILSVRDLIHFLAENFPAEIYNLPPDPHQVAQAPEGA